MNYSYWKEYNDGERAFLLSANGEQLAYIQKKNGMWDCTIFLELIATNFYYMGIASIEEVEWQMTLYINNECNKIANRLYKIRDHLPSIHELAERAKNEQGENNVESRN